ncbi:MAG: hypothetical protein HYT87_00835 [Nitrospirae bacterium]|nr:hypothetical protein [Nitrospirota bacterium]
MADAVGRGLGGAVPNRAGRELSGRWESGPAVSPDLHQLGLVLERIRRRFPVLPVMAIPWLYLKHPVHAVQESVLTQEGGPDAVLQAAGKAGSFSLRSIWSSTRTLWRFALRTGKTVRTIRASQRREIQELTRRNFDVVIKTWCYGPARAEDGSDFYFGDLQGRLERKGVRTLMICGDGSSGDPHAFARSRLSTKEKHAMAEVALVPPSAPIQMAILQTKWSWRLAREASRATDPVERGLCRQASQDCLGLLPHRNGLFYWIGREVARRWSPRVFLTLYEGHGWEKCAGRGIKEISPATRIAGYAHTMLFPESLSLIRPTKELGPGSTPDLVLCLGEETLAAMRSGHDVHGIDLIRFGSCRRRLRSGASQPRSNLGAVLFVPEGLETEVDDFYRAAEECARRFPDREFILRAHPMLPDRRVLASVRESARKWPNLEISERPVEEDFARSSFVIYRGSSAALHAVLQGLRPVYLRGQSAHSGDPLAGMNEWRLWTESPGALAEVLDTAFQPDYRPDPGAWENALKYVETYLGLVTERSISTFLEAAGFTHRGGAA